MPRGGCQRTVPTTGCVRYTATSPGTSNCDPKPSASVARHGTPTPHTIRGCSNDCHPRPPAGSRRGEAAHDQRGVVVPGVEVEGASQEPPRQIETPVYLMGPSSHRPGSG